MSKADIQNVKLRFGIVGNNETLIRDVDVAIQVAPTDLSVLIQGESGVGKEVFPQIIHQNSRRKHGVYIAVNCGAIPEGTIDSELFGHEKGSFTGAISERKGYFGEANGGTIFLDEVGELPLATQARLLRVLESGEFMKVGSSKVEKTDVRIVAATNVNLTNAIAKGEFREDLYYRLNTIPIKVPPLRERDADVVLLFKKFAADFSEKYRTPGLTLTEDAKVMLMSYSWPGNVRQLKNITEQISILEKEREITGNILSHYLPEDDKKSSLPVLSTNMRGRGYANTDNQVLQHIIFELNKEVVELRQKVEMLMQSRDASMISNEYEQTKELPEISISTKHELGDKYTADEVHELEEMEEVPIALEDMEKQMIEKALQRNHNNRKHAAGDLGISERTLYRKIKEYGL